LFAAAAGLLPVPVAWSELSLSIEQDRSVSSDQATLCRVRVVNHGSSTWSGRRLVFEARGLRDGRVHDVRTGRFGLTLGPRETLETVVGFLGRYDRFEVSPKDGSESYEGGSSGRRSRRRSGKRR
jgi:hypothetical protein